MTTPIPLPDDALDIADIPKTMRTIADGILAYITNDLVNSAPGTLDTLKELADALGDDPNFSATIVNLLSQKVNISDVVTVAQAGKILKLNLDGKLPADITGNAETATKFKTPRVINGETDYGNNDFNITQINGKDIATVDKIPVIPTIPQIFISELLDIPANTTVEVSHGLGGQPTFFTAYLKCIVPNFGYAVDDYCAVYNNYGSNMVFKNDGYANATKVGIAVPGGLIVPRRDTPAVPGINFSHWKLVLVAMR